MHYLLWIFLLHATSVAGVGWHNIVPDTPLSLADCQMYKASFESTMTQDRFECVLEGHEPAD